jgi:hypothetical protein
MTLKVIIKTPRTCGKIFLSGEKFSDTRRIVNMKVKVRDIPSKLTDIIYTLDIDQEKMIGYQIVPRPKAIYKVLFRVIYRNGESINYEIVAEDGPAFNLTVKDFKDSDALDEYLDDEYLLDNIPWFDYDREELWRDYSYYKNLEED